MRLRLAGIAFACALALAATVVSVATADPSKGSDPLLYEFTDCSDGSGFTAIKQRSEGAALFLTDGSGRIFIAMAAISDRLQTAQDGTVIEEGTIFFQTPGFTGRNDLPTITCTNFSPLSETWSSITGYISRS